MRKFDTATMLRAGDELDNALNLLLTAQIALGAKASDEEERAIAATVHQVYDRLKDAIDLIFATPNEDEAQT